MQKYKKIKIVGKGSFGFAVLVESRKNKKQYIMKIIDISKMDEKQIQQALMEVHLLKVMRYPYVVTYRQSFMEKMCLCIVMDYCQGGDMFHKIAKQKQLGVLFPEHQIVTWFVQMALAMNYVHDKKILHRDLKTQNIFLTSKGDIKIGDFGIARVLQHTYDCANTAIGTPYYLSPQICQEKPYNQKSDIWSLGCILYEIATLNHAFDAQNMKGLVQKILKGTYPPLPEMYSSDLKKLISEMLIKDPNKRPSIRKILQMPFMKAKINQLFSNTLKTHELQLQKQNTLKGDMFRQQILKAGKSHQKERSRDKSDAQNRNRQKEKEKEKERQKEKQRQRQKEKEKEKPNMFRKKDEPRKESRKIEIISKNQSEVGFAKKSQSNENNSLSKQSKQIRARIPLHQETSTNRSVKQEISRQKKDKDRERQTKQKDRERISNSTANSINNNSNSINNSSSSKLSGKKSLAQQQQTLEEQGYGVLLRDMKRCIKGQTREQQKQWKIEQKDKIVPKYLQFQQIPGYSDKDTVGSKIQALRVYLQRIVGNEFFDAYKMIQQDKDEDYEQVKNLLGASKIKFIPLIVQLIVCQDNYY